MALDYFLLIDLEDQNADPLSVRELLLSSFPPRAIATSRFMLQAEGVDVYISAEDPERAQRKGKSRPGISILFEINKFDKFDIGISKMLQMVNLLLRRFDGDAELSIQMDDVLLSRSGGQILLADDSEFWTDERKAIFLVRKPEP
jgi:hypothetical protein